MITFLKTRPILFLTLLLLTNLLLLSVQARDETSQVLLRSWGVTVRTPLGGGIQFLKSLFMNSLDRYVLLVGAERENQSLRAENEQLKLETQRLNALVGAALRTRDFDRIYERHQLETIAATITQRSAPFLATSFQINAGRAHGVISNAAVIRPEGIVGRVQALTSWSSEVQPITQPQAGAGAVLSQSRTHGVVRGQGSELVRLDYIPISVPVEVGEMVYTSGTDKIYPKGLPIGKVISVTEGNLVHKHILVRPSVNLSRTEEVLLVTTPVVDRGPESTEESE
jgi:rod shape-determining protein MreC